jgi:nitrite reductase/ring-hydroxylating ferredoxin subunit
MHVTTARFRRGIAESEAFGKFATYALFPSTRSLNESTAAMVGGEITHSDRLRSFFLISSQQYPVDMRWLDVIAAEDLQAGQILTVEREAGDVVLWRTESGRIAACDARCPHQWANLGTAGAVDGEEIVCLSHFWRFDQEGTGSKLSAKGRRDEKSPIDMFEVRERDGRLEIAVPE